jgi:hypothetical protein
LTGAADFTEQEALGCGDYQATTALANVLTGVGEASCEPQAYTESA